MDFCSFAILMASLKEASIWASSAPITATNTPRSRCISAYHQRPSDLSASTSAAFMASRASGLRSAGRFWRGNCRVSCCWDPQKSRLRLMSGSQKCVVCARAQRPEPPSSTFGTSDLQVQHSLPGGRGDAPGTGQCALWDRSIRDQHILRYDRGLRVLSDFFRFRNRYCFRLEPIDLRDPSVAEWCWRSSYLEISPIRIENPKDPVSVPIVGKT